jgi:hypothetical protein
MYVIVPGGSIILAFQVTVAVTLTTSERSSNTIGVVRICLCTSLINLGVLASKIRRLGDRVKD